MNHIEALTKALALAITAPTDEDCKKAVILAASIADSMTEEEVEFCKQAAIDILS